MPLSLKWIVVTSIAYLLVEEYYHVISEPKGSPRDFRALLLIIIKLIQKYVKEDKAIGVDNL
ncbi:hypothetical protein BJ875DRAFT_475595 [Amylocarpus encephaloides]|uniref:Uncharacterized protein n=1 Tax=Amylocarpus encephaloides TaxID=45428 RepID=A0A9P8C0S2_9HELO|nr:hypothetical protein BJ875DRAFT_475595 [Amylocarpus encephaloides]